jgi:hypothetical protein
MGPAISGCNASLVHLIDTEVVQRGLKELILIGVNKSKNQIVG